ncbi:caspase domain-containing protein [Pseudomonas sp. A-B-26]|uniref:caspase family protein n=1 Tax=Pseudomonas sp. A-B-26 TaxID=2832406 RepID=UPI001CC072B7|nr:caspase family protein [Pseudomonas sp. A-B-26]
MNLALLIGIDTYDRLPALPACANDLSIMHQTLKATNKYHHIELIDNATAENAKEKLRSFFASHNNTPDIEEIFVYFSGHGAYQDDALFCCADFDAKRAATTSISNTELDDLLRGASPKVAVKVIDACQSGAPYIKDVDNGFLKSIKTSRLSSFICMASSQHDQYSYASSLTSHFTAAWVEAALSKTTGSILYRDIQASLADTFALSPSQTPFFVNQGSALELFSIVTEEMISLHAVRSSSPEQKSEKNISETLRQRISKNDSQFVEFGEVTDTLNKSIELLSEAKIQDALVSEFYKKSVNPDLKLSGLPRAGSFAEFGSNHGWEKKYFIDVQEETYSAPNPLSVFGFGSGREQTIEKTRPAYVLSTESLPVEAVEIAFNAINPSLPSYRTYIGIIHSNTEALILTATASLTQKGWDKKILERSEIKWEYSPITWQAIIREPALIWERGIKQVTDIVRVNLENLSKQPTE